MPKCYEMTISNLSALGVLEEAYDIYKGQHDLCLALVDSAIDDIVENHDGLVESFICKFPGKYKEFDRIIDISYLGSIRDECHKYLSKRLIDFFSEYYFLFTSEFSKDALNTLTPNSFRTCGVPFVSKRYSTIHMEQYFLGFKIQMCNFSSFLKIVEYSLATCLIGSSRYTESLLEQTLEKINAHMRIAVGLEQRRVLHSQNAEFSKDSLYVYKSLSRISCNMKMHRVIPDDFLAPLLSGGAIKLPIHKCQTCGKVFIGENTLRQYSDEYGPFLINKSYDTSEAPDFATFSVESKLHSLGYNVIDGNMTDEERRCLLVALIENGYITYNEAIRDIDNAINIFHKNKRFASAVSKWSKDLKFLGDQILQKSKKRRATL